MHTVESEWPVAPMEPIARGDAFDSADTFFQMKWDGVRVLSYSYPEGVRLFSRRLHERTRQYPELICALEALPAGTVLDGEVVALGRDGKPDFPRVLRRDLVSSAAKIKLVTAAIPVFYMVFDILWLNGTETMSRPLTERLEILDGLTLGGNIIKVDSVDQNGIALFDAVKREGLEGIVAKKKNSIYLSGKKTDLWQKIKTTRNLIGVVGGYIAGDRAQIRSLLVGIPEEEGLRYIGSASSGLTNKQMEKLKEALSKKEGSCPFVNPPTRQGAKWVMPQIKLQVRFLEYTAEGVMRGPSITGFPEGIE